MMAAAAVPIDCVIDLLPPAADPTWVRAAILTLRPSGRPHRQIGWQGGGFELPYRWLMRNGLAIRGQWMYPREAVPPVDRPDPERASEPQFLPNHGVRSRGRQRGGGARGDARRPVREDDHSVFRVRGLGQLTSASPASTSAIAAEKVGVIRSPKTSQPANTPTSGDTKVKAESCGAA